MRHSFHHPQDSLIRAREKPANLFVDVVDGDWRNLPAPQAVG
jgi:hypothetical protein